MTDHVVTPHYRADGVWVCSPEGEKCGAKVRLAQNPNGKDCGSCGQPLPRVWEHTAPPPSVDPTVLPGLGTDT